MYQLLLTQKQANKLLFELKELAQRYNLIISRNSINQLKLKTKDARNLVLTCTYHIMISLTHILIFMMQKLA